MTTPIGRYASVPRFLHWLTVILVIVAWTLGTFGDDLPKGAARETGLFCPHFRRPGDPDGARHALGLARGRAATAP